MIEPQDIAWLIILAIPIGIIIGIIIGKYITANKRRGE